MNCEISDNISEYAAGIFAYSSSMQFISTNTSGDLWAEESSTFGFDAESICDVAGDVTPTSSDSMEFDLDDLSTTASLLVSGTLHRSGGLAVTNDSGTLFNAEVGDVIPLTHSQTLDGNFDSIVLPPMPEGLGLQLIESLVPRGNDTEIAVEVIEINGAEFSNPFSGDLDSPPIDIIEFDADGDGADELATLFPGSPGAVATLLVSENSSPATIEGLNTSVGNNPVSIDSADLNGDGFEDLLVANSTDNTISVLLTNESSDGVLYFDVSTLVVPGGSQSITCVAIINWDGDEELDAVVGVDIADENLHDGYQVLLDVATSSPIAVSFSEINKYEISPGIFIADPPTCVDGGNLGSSWGFVGGTRYGQIHRGNSVSSLQLIDALDSGSNIVTIEAIDLDDGGGDGQLDLMVGSDEAESIYLFQGDAAEADGFGDLIPLLVSAPVEDALAISADFDGDMDILIAAPTSDTPLVLLRNDGGGSGLIGSLSGITWSKQILNANSVNTATRLANGTLGGKDEDDDWIVGAGGAVGFQGEPVGVIEQTNILLGGVCAADLDGDGEVKVADLLILIGDWGLCPECDSDLDNDGEVKVADLLLLIAAWGLCE